VKRALSLAALALLAGCGGHGATSTRPDVELIAGCDPLYYERPGLPRLVVVSDLPLRGPDRSAMAQATQTIKLLLKDRGFRAGRFSVGYVSCSDSGLGGAWSPRICRANARAFARARRVVATIGTFDSGCMRLELPTLNTAGIVAVSPYNTAPDLTRDRRFRRHGVSYVRLVADEDTQAAAAATFARAKGSRTVAVVGDGTPYAANVLRAFRAAAAGAGIAEVERRADAVFAAGLLSHRTGSLLRRAHARGGSLLLPEGLGPVGQLAGEVGTAADGAAMTVGGIPPEDAGQAARAFGREFERKFGPPPQPYAYYAAQAAQLVFDAIARSDGTRGSIRRSVLSARVDAGLIGSFSFTREGNITPAPVTILHVRDGRAVVDSVLRMNVR
jgi:branched-chain amino acid transport system substrate-binding protein